MAKNPAKTNTSVDMGVKSGSPEAIAAWLVGVLDDDTATHAAKMSAVKELRIMSAGETGGRGGLGRLSREEIRQELGRLRALLPDKVLMSLGTLSLAKG